MKKASKIIILLVILVCFFKNVCYADVVVHPGLRNRNIFQPGNTVENTTVSNTFENEQSKTQEENEVPIQYQAESPKNTIIKIGLGVIFVAIICLIVIIITKL